MTPGRNPHVLLLTGVPGIGKTTVIQRLATMLRGAQLRGFYTEEIRERGDRRGFRLVGFGGMTRIIAHIDFATTHRVGKYGVDVAAVDQAASMLTPDRGASIYLVDEIGKMECLSQRFVAAVRTLIAGRAPVVATIARRGTDFIAEVKRSENCVLWEVTRANRDELPSRVLAWVAEARAANPGLWRDDLEAPMESHGPRHR